MRTLYKDKKMDTIISLKETRYIQFCLSIVCRSNVVGLVIGLISLEPNAAAPRTLYPENIPS